MAVKEGEGRSEREGIWVMPQVNDGLSWRWSVPCCLVRVETVFGGVLRCCGFV